MSTTSQTLTLAGEDYVVIRRAEYERLGAAADEASSGVPGALQHLQAPADLRLGERQRG